MSYIQAGTRGAVLSLIIVAMLVPSMSATISRDCRDMMVAHDGCTCHNGTPSCCMAGLEVESSSKSCGCEMCGELEVPREEFLVVQSPQVKRFDNLVPEVQVTASYGGIIAVDTPAGISPLDHENRFTTQVSSQIAVAIVIC